MGWRNEMTPERNTWTVPEFAEHAGVSEAEVVQAINTGDLAHSESESGTALITINEQSAKWITSNAPANIYADLAGDPQDVPTWRMQLLAKLPHLARRLSNADYAALTISDSKGRIKEMIVSGMSKPQTETIDHPPVGRGVLGSLDRADAPLRLPDISQHPRSTGFPEGHPDMHAMIGVGITADHGTEGEADEYARIYVSRVVGQPPFTAEEQALVESLAAFAKQALDFDTLRKEETKLRIRAEQAEQAKSRFMSMINHDLRNPVAAMMAALETANIDDEYAEEQLVDDLKSSLRLQESLVGSLLDMARLGESIEDYEVEDSYPIDMIQQCVRRQKLSPLGQHRTIEIDVPGNLPIVRCDPVQMGRVFDNLVSNALKYSSDEVKIVARKSSGDRGVTWQIIDRGIGVPEAQQETIFEPFERINSGDKPIEGLGLGLAICKSIVEAHNGTITQSNNPNKNPGSTFTITLPID